MTTPATSIATTAETPAPAAATVRSVWKSKYAERHRLERIQEFPAGINPPRRVRIYRRRHYYMLQWWDRAEKRTLSHRIDGDLIEAVAAARKIDEKLARHRTAGIKSEKVTFHGAAQKFVADLERRADAGEIDPITISRYASALKHLLAFAEQPHVARRWPYVGRIDRDFQLALAAYLQCVQIAPNGHPNARRRPLKGHNYILDVTRALLEWACDPQRGGLLPGDFRNPFARRTKESRTFAADLLQEPDISVPMAVDLVSACDDFQLAIFATLLLYGLRPGELGWVFREDLEQGWLRVRCHVELDHFTTGAATSDSPCWTAWRPCGTCAARARLPGCSIGNGAW